jgi:transmembrane sensor
MVEKTISRHFRPACVPTSSMSPRSGMPSPSGTRSHASNGGRSALGEPAGDATVVPVRRRSGKRTWLLGGALLGAGVVTLVWRQERAHLALGSASAAPVRLSVPSGVGPRTYPLADGSRVTLAPGSSLESRGAYGDANRRLHLVGEAMFTVVEGEAPFVVVAAGVEVEDVSTAFVVRAMPATTATPARALVSVTEGEVRVSAAPWHGTIREGHAMLVDIAGGHVALDDAEARGSLAWTSGALLFADEAAASVIERLTRWTGLEINVDPTLAAHRVTLAIERASPEETVHLVAEALDARAVATGGHWVIRPR